MLRSVVLEKMLKHFSYRYLHLSKCKCIFFWSSGSWEDLPSIFALLPHPTPGDHDLSKPESVLYLEAINFSGSGVLKKKFKCPHLILHFCDCFPFKIDTVLHLNKFESLSPLNDVYQVWLKLASWLWRRKCEKFTDRWIMENGGSE